MRSTESPDGSLRPIAAACLEGSWVTLVYLLVTGLWSGGFAPLPWIAFVGAALLGLVVARRWTTLRGFPYEAALAAIALAVALAGAAVPLPPLASGVPGGPLAVLSAHPAGILLGVAFVRGARRASPADDEPIAEIALGPGLAVVGAIWLAIAGSGLGRQPATAGGAFAATVAYTAAALTSLGLARMADVRRQGVAGADRRSWVVLLLGIVGALVVLAIPLGALVGIPLDGAIRSVAGPAWDVAVALAAVLIWPAALLVAALGMLFGALLDLIGFVPRPLPSPILSGQTLPPEPPGPPLAIDPTLVVLVLLPIVLALVFAALVRLLRRPRRVVEEAAVVEVRERERPSAFVRLPRLPTRRPRSHGDPRSASEAYLASIALLAGRTDGARTPSETPSEHARRVRSVPGADGIGRLAADYALAEFGGRRLSSAEHARAIGRWRSIRRTVGR